jgi:CRISPR-associated endonuclease/helicase Cas3
MLDVAACAEGLLAAHSPDLPAERRSALCLLTALHDLGKFNPGFRAMLTTNASQGKWKHWQVSEAYLRHKPIETILLGHLDCTKFALRALTAAVAGHHGRPANVNPHDGIVDKFVLEGLPIAIECVRAFCDLWPDATLTGMNSIDAQRLSWWLSGLTVAADWIGSNQRWFAPCPPDHSLADYRVMARQRAALALAGTGIMPAAPSDRRLFDFALRPMQQAAATIALPDGPMLAFIEDETGAGKTEAALILAQRMLLAGKGHGLFFALPTMATTDAMFARLHTTVGRLFQTPPSLALAHGRARFSEKFRQLGDSAFTSDDSVCSDWIRDNRRRALLANVGVGTIDQALLAVLPTKFATLRAWGLAGKLLIVDEVHELGNPYMAQELARLLELHATNGGSAIMMTATLPIRQRQQLSDAFDKGASRASAPDHSPAYPSLSIVGGAARRDFERTPSPKGPVAVNRLNGMDEALDLLDDACRTGAACVWVRNAVDDAIAAVEALRQRGIAADLLHARYALADRRRIEQRLHQYFGRDGSDRCRADGVGRVLVGTQVLEASLDIDFDVMLSDLAPMAALIQRAGRLWRHMDVRPAHDRPVPAPVLHILSPDPAQVASDMWLHALQPSGAYVYPLADQWRTADTLFRAGAIVAPDGLRALIEAVHGDAAGDIPDVLLDSEARSLGAAQAEAGLGRQNCVKLDEGYRAGGRDADDREYPTRLGQETCTLLLARYDGEDLVPWAAAPGNNASRAEQEALSEVSVRVARLSGKAMPDQQAPAILRFIRDWPDWRKASVRVCPLADDGELCDGLRYQPDLGLIFVSPHTRG